MRAFYSDTFVLPLPAGHRFPMEKYSRLRERLLTDGILLPEQLFVPDGANDEQLLRVHDPAYLAKVKAGDLTAYEQQRMSFPWSPEMVERSRRSVGATIDAARAALEDGISVNLAGGTHHAFADKGEGFCVFNDVVVAARELQAQGLARRILVVDTDVHQGNGTAALVRDDPTIFAFSIHGAKNYPLRKERSDIDIALADGADDVLYQAALHSGLARSIRLADADFAFVVSGADPYEGDRLGRLRLSMDGLRARDETVLGALRDAGMPTVVTMGGGYARDIDEIVAIHVATIEACIAIQPTMPRRRTGPPGDDDHDDHDDGKRPQ